MEMPEVVNLFTNTGVSIGIIVYFIFRDLKWMGQLNTTLITLVDTVNALKDLIRRNNDED